MSLRSATRLRLCTDVHALPRRTREAEKAAARAPQHIAVWAGIHPVDAAEVALRCGCQVVHFGAHDRRTRWPASGASSKRGCFGLSSGRAMISGSANSD